MVIFHSFLYVYQRLPEGKWNSMSNRSQFYFFCLQLHKHVYSPPARWGLLDFMSVACSSSPLLSSSSPLLLLLVVLLVLLVQLRPAIHSVLCRTSTTTIHAQCSLPDLNREYPCQVFPAGPQPWPSTPSVPCRTSTTSIHAQCSLPDLNHDHPRPVFPAGPQPRVSMPSVPCRTSCRKIWDKVCAEES